MPYASIYRHVMRLLVVVGFGVIGLVIAGAGASAQGDTPEAPQDCVECHIDIVAAWETGAHAQAYEDPVFQEAWHAQNDDVECLACHTTGFVARTGEYEHEGVTCQACHGQTPENHPPEPVAVNPGVEICADCHTTTFTEWEQSKHGEQQLGCTTCHSPHPQQLRFDSTEALCLNCHNEEPRDDFAHLTHVDQVCTDCHWHRSEPEAMLEHVVSGNLLPTGHEAHVGTQACIACHAEVTESDIVEEQQAAGLEMGLTSEHPLLEAQVRIEELEAEVDTVKAQGSNTSSLRLAQGLIVGVAVGMVVVSSVGAVRRRVGSTNVDHHPDDAPLESDE
jgi:predicted CXXCH cytochrome family protein